MRLAMAQLNPRVGDITGNTDRVLQTIDRAGTDVDLLIFPELMLTGYPPEDLLYRSALYRMLDEAVDRIRSASGTARLLLGLPRRVDGRLYNSCVCIDRGSIVGWYDKMSLPNYGVFDEKRYFTPGTQPLLVDLGELKAAVTICEDIWVPEPAALAAATGADLLVNINASPFHLGKAEERRQVLAQRVAETGLPVIYTNMVGGQDELVFDGGSMIIDATGDVLCQAITFTEELVTCELATDPAGKVNFRRLPASAPAPSSEEETVYAALVLAVRDYVHKNGFNGVVIGLSGGIDSALVTCLAADALGPENVEVVLMPSRYTAAMSIEDSITMAGTLGVKYRTLSIEKPFAAFSDLLEPVFAGLPADATEENIQARCRGILLMAISNKSRCLVLTTGNKSEMAVGYATLYGDMAGGFAPLKDVPKLLVYRLANWRNRLSTVIPQRIIDRPPSAELRPDQRDDDSLPDYAILDPILERYIERDQSPEQIIAAGFKHSDVERVVRLVDSSEYKRRQAAPGVKISKRAFGRERRYPISSGYRET